MQHTAQCDLNPPILWIAAVAYGLHMIEETVFNWHGWVWHVLKLPAQWHEFYMVNAVVIVFGIGAATVGWRKPAFSLAFPAFMLVNALFFHIGPMAFTGIFSPGVVTAVMLFLPIGFLSYRAAHHAGILSVPVLVVSILTGAAVMAVPVVAQKTKCLPVIQAAAGEVSPACGQR